MAAVYLSSKHSRQMIQELDYCMIRFYHITGE